MAAGLISWKAEKYSRAVYMVITFSRQAHFFVKTSFAGVTLLLPPALLNELLKLGNHR